MKKKQISLYAFLYLLFSLHCAQAQGWLRTAPPGSMRGMIAHPQGGVVVGYTHISAGTALSTAQAAYFQADGTLAWAKNIPNLRSLSQIKVGADGLPAVWGIGNGDALVRMDWDGNILSEQTYFTNYFHHIEMEAFPTGGGVHLEGNRDSLFTPPTRLNFKRRGANGQILWSSFIDTLASNEWVQYGSIAVNHQGYSIYGISVGIPQSANHLAVIDSNGVTLWRRNDLRIYQAGVFPDGNFFYIYSATTGFPEVHMRKITPAGDVIWEKALEQYNLGLNDSKHVVMPNGNLAIFAACPNGHEGMLSVQEFDPEGTLLNTIIRPLPGLPVEFFTGDAILPSETAGYYLCGNFFVDDSSFLYVLKMNAQGIVYQKRLTGLLAHDTNENCNADPGETGLAGHLVRMEDLVTGQFFYAVTDSSGKYLCENDSSSYLVSPLLNNPYWENCLGDTVVQFGAADTIRVDFPLKKVVECPFLEVDISIWGLRRCFNNTYTVRYCNTGTTAAANPYVEVLLDPYLQFVSASIPGAQVGDHLWRFPVESLDYGDCGSFTVTAYLDCDSTLLGQSHCTEAHIFPDSVCLQNSQWSGANVDVGGVCRPDSVELIIRNIGTAPNAGVLDYVIIEDNIIFLQGNFQLDANDSLVIKVPANGSTWRLEAEQEPFAPGDPMPSATVEGCGTNENGSINLGFVSQFGENDGNPFLSRDCRENRGSFDPNEKEAFPKGVGEAHWVEPGTQLSYLIRFQNTGTDTAFTVKVEDRLTSWLDPETVRLGAFSHPCRFEIIGSNLLRFTFPQILLPDSTVNEPQSHGFVQFFVKIRPDAPLDAVITNNADIYFDFNAPITTNTVQHTIGRNFLLRKQPAPAAVPDALDVMPNPAFDQTVVSLRNGNALNGRLDLMDAWGRVLRSQNFYGTRATLNVNQLPAGLYFIRAFDGEKWLGGAKLNVVGK